MVTHDDDLPVGRLLTRREIIRLLGAAGISGVGGAAAIAGRAPAAFAQVPACVVVPQQTQGPYFVDERLERSDVRADPSDGRISEGTDLSLSLRLSRLGTDGACAPLAGALVDLWQCDALGVYSDVEDRRLGFNTKGRKFLRGHQTTDATGLVRFRTIYPGWYPGRAVHIHFKIRTNPSAPRDTEFVSQLYFDERITDEVHAAPPYSTKGPRTSTNDRDGIYRNGGRELMLTLSKERTGYAGSFALAVKSA